MSTHNICFRGEIRKVLCGYPSYLELCFYLFSQPRQLLFLKQKVFKLQDQQKLAIRNLRRDTSQSKQEVESFVLSFMK